MSPGGAPVDGALWRPSSWGENTTCRGRFPGPPKRTGGNELAAQEKHASVATGAAPDSRECARAKNPPGCEETRGPEGRMRAVPRDWQSICRGGAERARPETRRALSSPDRRCLAVPGLLRPARIAPAAARTGRGSCVWHGPARTLLNAQHVRHRPGPIPPPSPACVTGSDRRSGPVAGFARRSPKRSPPASGVVMAVRLPARTAPRQRGPCGAFPPACIETFAIHPAAGVRRLWHGTGGCG